MKGEVLVWFLAAAILAVDWFVFGGTWGVTLAMGFLLLLKLIDR